MVNDKDLYLLTGSNLSNRKEMLEEATKRLTECFGRAVNISSIYETAAWGKENQQAFLNQVLVFKSGIDPKAILRTILDIELKMGRVRTEKWGARTIDIDILYYGDILFHDEELTIPHPYLEQRKFTLMPLAELAPEFIHPKLRKTTAELLQLCEDKLEVNLFTEDC
jgi:2-amino-4-hydroxy-6-hydroxymethyldihydropteridine diphosphokinase